MSLEPRGQDDALVDRSYVPDRHFGVRVWDVPFGTMVKVTNLDNGRSVIVRITDRGPGKRLRKKRVIDLTRGAFAHLAPLRQGLVPVVVHRIR